MDKIEKEFMTKIQPFFSYINIYIITKQPSIDTTFDSIKKYHDDISKPFNLINDISYAMNSITALQKYYNTEINYQQIQYCIDSIFVDVNNYTSFLEKLTLFKNILEMPMSYNILLNMDIENHPIPLYKN